MSAPVDRDDQERACQSFQGGLAQLLCGIAGCLQPGDGRVRVREVQRAEDGGDHDRLRLVQSPSQRRIRAGAGDQHPVVTGPQSQVGLDDVQPQVVDGREVAPAQTACPPEPLGYDVALRDRGLTPSAMSRPVGPEAGVEGQANGVRDSRSWSRPTSLVGATGRAGPRGAGPARSGDVLAGGVDESSAPASTTTTSPTNR